MAPTATPARRSPQRVAGTVAPAPLPEPGWAIPGGHRSRGQCHPRAHPQDQFTGNQNVGDQMPSMAPAPLPRLQKSVWRGPVTDEDGGGQRTAWGRSRVGRETPRAKQARATRSRPRLFRSGPQSANVHVAWRGSVGLDTSCRLLLHPGANILSLTYDGHGTPTNPQDFTKGN